MKRGRRSVVLAAVAAPFMLLQIDLSSCLPGSGGTTGGGTAFNLPPTVVLSADVTRGVAPLTVRFSSSGSTDDGLIVDRLWDFGDNQTSRDISPIHTFSTTGQFTVRLTLTDDRGARSSRSQIISVTEQPIAVIVVDRTAAESAPAVFNFDGSQSRDPDGTITDYRWDFGDGSREVQAVVPHTFSRPGTFRVRLTVTDNTGVTGFSETIIEVGIPRPTISFRSPPPGITNLVVSRRSPLWVDVVFGVEPGTPYALAAGLDGDSDPCDAQAALFSLSDGSRLLTYTGHANRVRAAVFSPGGASVLTASDDRTLRLYDAATGDLRQSYGNNTGGITSVAFSPDGSLFVYGQDDGAVVLRNTSSGSVIRELRVHTQPVNAVAFSPRGNQVLSGSDDTRAILYNVLDGSVARTFTGHTFGVTAVAFSPRDSTVVLTGSVDQTARLWDANSGVSLVTFAPVFSGGTIVSGHASAISAVAFSPDATLVLTASDDRTAKLWNVSGGAEIRTFSGHTNRLAAANFSADGKQIITGSFDGTARLWNVSTGAQLRSIQPCTSTVSSVAFSADGTQVLTGIAARNSIQLDTVPPSGNDINLAIPSALDLLNVPNGQYFLFAQVDTDRTAPVRTYSAATVNVVGDFTASIDNFTPRVPLTNDRASVVVEPTARRQIFDLGPLAAGDRLFLSLLTTPGYSSTFTDDFYSVMILDADRKVFAWYQDGAVLFTGDSKVIVGHNSQNYYVVVDSGDSVNIRVQRGAGVSKRQQRVVLNFNGGLGLSVAGCAPTDIAAFSAVTLGRPAGDTATIKNQIVTTLRSKFAGWNVVVSTTDEAIPPLPFQTVHFGTRPMGGVCCVQVPNVRCVIATRDDCANVFMGQYRGNGTQCSEDACTPRLIPCSDFTFEYGIADYIDPRNDTLTGSALVDIGQIGVDFAALTATQVGELIGVVAAHECGHLFGLRHVDGMADIMSSSGLDASQVFANSPLTGAEQYQSQIGFQDAPQLLEELTGTAP